MPFNIELLIVLVAAGIVLLVAEIYLPGAIAGILGGISLLAAAIISFNVYGPVGGMVTTAVIVILCGVVMVLWLKYFPTTSVGKKVIVEQDLSTSKAANPEYESLVGMEGESLSELRPAGFASLGKRRIDVVTRGELIEKGVRIRVLEVTGNRIVVARAGAERR